MGRGYCGSAHGLGVPCKGARGATERNQQRLHPTPTQRRPAELQRTGAADFRSTAGVGREYLLGVFAALPTESATTPPPSTAECEHHQCSGRSPVLLTGDHGLYIARSLPGLRGVRSGGGSVGAPGDRDMDEDGAVTAVVGLQKVFPRRTDAARTGSAWWTG